MGDSGDCCSFLIQCELHFQVSHYPTDCSKIAYIISLLTGQAEAWATAKWSPVVHSSSNTDVSHSVTWERSSKSIDEQGKRRVSNCAIEFCILSADSDLNSSTVFDAFRHGLSPAIKDQLIAIDLPKQLDSLIALTIKIDKRLLEGDQEQPKWRSADSTHTLIRQPISERHPSQILPSKSEHIKPQDQPMELRRTHLRPEE